MSGDVSSAFLVRRPLLQHVAEMLRIEVCEFLNDEEIPSKATFEVMDLSTFLSDAASLSNPLVEVQNQIAGRILIPEIEFASRIEGIFRQIFSVHQSKWLDIGETQLPCLQLTCVVPPQAMPEGWRSRNDVPKNFQVRIQVGEVAPDIRVYTQKGYGPVPLIMMGGGIKGLAYVGALEELNQHYEFNWFVGTSAGAITAVLLGAGYTPVELRQIMADKNFRDFFDASYLKALINFVRYGGFFRADALTEWLDVLLAKKLRSKTRVRLSQLPNRVTVYACRRGKRSLMFDSKHADADAAHAARCSMSIPYVFTPQYDQGIQTYDGGIHQNYPVEEFLRSYPNQSFVSLFLGTEHYEPVRSRAVIWDLLSIVTEGSDAESVSKYREQTVIIDTRPIGVLDFSLSDDEKVFLSTCGLAGAVSHICDGTERQKQVLKERDDLREKIKHARVIKRRWFWGKMFLIAVAVPSLYLTYRYFFPKI